MVVPHGVGVALAAALTLTEADALAQPEADTDAPPEALTVPLALLHTLALGVATTGLALGHADARIDALPPPPPPPPLLPLGRRVAEVQLEGAALAVAQLEALDEGLFVRPGTYTVTATSPQLPGPPPGAPPLPTPAT